MTMTHHSRTFLLERANAPLELGPELGRGGEAVVYDVVGDPTMVAKIKHAPMDDGDVRKLRTMLAHPPQDPTLKQFNHHSIAWPGDLIVAAEGAKRIPVGFVMPKITTSVTLAELMHPRRRSRIAPAFSYRYLLNIGKNLAIVLKNIHEKGHIVGDMNTLNVLVSTVAATSTLVTVVDCDSFQIKANDGTVFRCNVGKPEYTAPEIQNRTFRQFDRTEQHDMFAFAVVMYQLLMQNAHPFQGVPKRRGFEVDLVHVHNIANGVFPHLDNPDMFRFPHAPSMMALPAPVRELFLRAFLPGYTRPSARDWRDVLSFCVENHESCPVDATHTRVRGEECVICEWEMVNKLRPWVGIPSRELSERDVPPRGTPITPPTVKAAVRAAYPLEALHHHAETVAGRLPAPYPYRRVALVGTDAFVIDGANRVRGYEVETGAPISLPETFVDAVALTTSGGCLYVLRSNGRVVGWSRQPAHLVHVPPTSQPLQAVAASSAQLLGLNADGTVQCWGPGAMHPPPGLQQIVQIAAGSRHCVAMSRTQVWIWGVGASDAQSVAASMTEPPYLVAAADERAVIITTDGVLHALGPQGYTAQSLAIELTLVQSVTICGETVFVHLTNHKVLTTQLTRPQPFAYVKIRDSAAAALIDVAFAPTAVVVQTETRLALLTTQNYGKTVARQRLVTYQTAGEVAALQQLLRAGSLLAVRQLSARQHPRLAAGIGFSAAVRMNQVVVSRGTTAPRWQLVVMVSAGKDFLVGIDTAQSVTIQTSRSLLAAAVPPQLAQHTRAVAAGAAHIVAAATNGTVYAWGENDSGQASVPPGVRDVVAVAAGAAHSLALRNNGTVIGWGADTHGQCSVPDGMPAVAQIAAAANCSAAVTVDGSLWLWGELRPGERMVFSGLQHVVSAAVGDCFGLVLFGDGSVAAWGVNDVGQAAPPTLPRPVVAIACGAKHALAELDDGSLVGWGDTTNGSTQFA